MKIVHDTPMDTNVPELAQHQRDLKTWALQEDTVYRIVLDSALIRPDVTPQATLGGRDLQWCEESSSFLAPIRFTPGFMLLELRLGTGAQRFGVEVLPNRDKLDASTWLCMLEELEAWHAGLTLGMEAAGLGVVDTVGVDAEFLAAALLPLVPALITAIERVARSPRELQRTIREEVPLHAIRRADRTSIRMAAKDPRVRVALDRWAPEWSGLDQPLLSQRRIVDTLDHPVNRFLAWTLRRVSSRLLSVADALRDESERRRNDDELKRLCRARADAARSAARALVHVRKRSFLGRLTPRPPSPAALQTLHDDPLYSRVYRLARPFLRPRFQLTKEPDPERAAPTHESFELYELWTLLATVRALKLAAPELTWRWTPTTHPSLLPGLGHGSMLVGRGQTDRRVELRYNPTFPSVLNVRRGERLSLSGTRRPDLTVRLDHAGASAWLVLDAKYRVSRRSLAEAFESLHIYHDTLYWLTTDSPPRESRPVAALILAPGHEAVCAPWFEPAFRQRYGVGCWRLRPGLADDDARRLGLWIMNTLRDAAHSDPG